MKFTRTGSAHWEGTGKDGKGTVATESTVLNNAPYSFKTRFEGTPGTNPEELLGAAHAGCFTMKLSFVLSEKGFFPGSLDTSARVTFQDGRITQVHLDLRASVDGITEEQFQEAANEAKANCPVSLLFNAEITLSATLVK